MSRSIQFQNHPFRFLLYLEWVLLFFTILTEALPSLHQSQSQLPLTVLIIVAFGVMGLKLPTGRQLDQVLYTSLEILLIILTTNTGSRALKIFPFLHLVLVTRSCLIFQLPGRLVVTGLSFTLFLWTLMPLTRRIFQRLPSKILTQEPIRFLPLGYIFLFGLCLVFVLLLISAVRAERQSRDKLMLANEQLRQYALRIENQATLQERNRIARDIHDSLGHSLTALNLQLETALKLGQSNPAKAQAFLERSKQLGSKALSEVRHSVSALRADPLQGRLLEEAIAALAEEVQRSTGISPIYSTILARPLPTEVSTALYRIVQESLTNICKYASATEVKIQLKATLTDLRLTVEDNGRGFNLDQNTTGFGLQSMRDRTLALGGQFKIDSQPSSGCRITADIPLPRLPE